MALRLRAAHLAPSPAQASLVHHLSGHGRTEPMCNAVLEYRSAALARHHLSVSILPVTHVRQAFRCSCTASPQGGFVAPSSSSSPSPLHLPLEGSSARRPPVLRVAGLSHLVGLPPVSGMSSCCPPAPPPQLSVMHGRDQPTPSRPPTNECPDSPPRSSSAPTTRKSVPPSSPGPCPCLTLVTASFRRSPEEMSLHSRSSHLTASKAQSPTVNGTVTVGTVIPRVFQSSSWNVCGRVALPSAGVRARWRVRVPPQALRGSVRTRRYRIDRRLVHNLWEAGGREEVGSVRPHLATARRPPLSSP